jgi:hypothetical protein
MVKPTNSNPPNFYLFWLFDAHSRRFCSAAVNFFVPRHMVWLITAFFLPLATDSFGTHQCDRQLIIFYQCQCVIQSKFFITRIGPCLGSVATRNSWFSHNDVCLIPIFPRSRRIDSKVPMISTQVLFDVSRDGDTHLGSHDGSAMVCCLINHESRSSHLPPHSLFQKACHALIDRPA